MFMKKLKKYYKWIIVAIVILIVSILTILIYKNLFEQGTNTRLEGIEEHELTKKEIKSVKESIAELETVNNVSVSTNYKIIKIFIELSEDVDFDDIIELSVQAVNNFSEKNLKFYDIEIFIDSLNKESEIYPRIGYKHKTNSDFTWNRWYDEK